MQTAALLVDWDGIVAWLRPWRRRPRELATLLGRFLLYAVVVPGMGFASVPGCAFGAVVVACILPLFVLKGPVRELPPRLGSVVLVSLVVLVIPYVLVGYTSPAFLLGAFVLELLSARLVSPTTDLLVVATGTCGMLWILVAVVANGAWRRRLLMGQLENVPTSQARSASLGLAEFRGRARVTRRGAEEPAIGSAFFLEDATGSILVEPAAALRAPTFLERLSLQRLCEVALDKPLEDGDPVYVMGSVEIRESAAPDATGAESLVVRRRTIPRVDSFSESFASAIRRDPEYVDIFFLARGDEASAANHLRRGIEKLLKAAAVVGAFTVFMTLTRLERVRPEGFGLAGPEADRERATTYLTYESPAYREAGKALFHSLDIDVDDASAMSTLVAFLEGSDDDLRSFAAHRLERITLDGNYLERVLQWSRDAHPAVRAAAAEALGEPWAPAAHAVPALTSLVTDEAPGVRMRAAKSLGRFAPAATESIETLVRALGDADEGVRSLAYDTIVAFGSVAAPALHEALDDPNDLAQEHALQALVSIAPESALTLYRDALARRTPALLSSATQGLRRLAAEARAAVPDLLPLVVHEDTRIREQALVALVAIDGESALGLGAAGLTPFLLSEDRDVHRLARALLEESGGYSVETILPTLTMGLRSKVDAVQERAIDAVSELGEPAREVAPLLLDIARAESYNRDPALRALGRLGDGASLAACLESDDAFLREAALRELEQLGSAAKVAVPALIEALEDPDLNDGAAVVLGRLGPEAKAALSLLRKMTASEEGSSDAARAILLIETEPPPPAGAGNDRPIVHLPFEGTLDSPQSRAIRVRRLDGSLGYEPGVVGQAVRVDGTPGVVVERDGEGVLVEGAFTLEMWFRFEGTALTATILDAGSVSIDSEGGRLVVWWRTGGEFPGATGHDVLNGKGYIEAKRWHHLAIVRDPHRRALHYYYNGLRTRTDVDYALSAKEALPYLESLPSITLGAFTGGVDEIRLYDYARTEEQTSASFGDGAGRP
jgi:HEAT repeat protein